MKLTEYKNKQWHYFFDELDRYQGKYVSYYGNGQVMETMTFINDNTDGEYILYFIDGTLGAHCFYDNGDRHGEYKEYSKNGKLLQHVFYQHGKRICGQVMALVKDVMNITDDEKIMIRLKFDIPCLKNISNIG